MSSRKQTRVWVDGCFDMMHFGHANLIRQAKCLGDYLIAGLHNDAEITFHKGPPLFTQDERYVLLSAVKWVDKVVKDAPYVTQVEVLQEHQCDFCVHGDDISVTEDGFDAYDIVKKNGKYVEVTRTEGISTTDLFYRILRAINRSGKGNSHADINLNSQTAPSLSPYTVGIAHYMPNALRIAQFMSPGCGSGHVDGSAAEGIRAVKPGERVVYAPGVFDLMHVGHVLFLQKCRELGSYLIVGLHSDETAALKADRLGPILNMNERFLSLLACRYVNNIILDAPRVITDELLDFFKVDVVAVGLHKAENGAHDDHTSDSASMAIPQERGIFRQIDSGSTVTTRQVIQRVMSNEAYENRNRRKEAKEAAIMSNPTDPNGSK